MKNIVDTVIDLINEKGEVSISEIKKSLKHLKAELNEGDLDASIYADLLNDGRFIHVNGKWDLKETYTMKEIVKEHYKALGNQENIMSEDNLDEDDEDDVVAVVSDDETQELDMSIIDELDDIDAFSDDISEN